MPYALHFNVEPPTPARLVARLRSVIKRDTMKDDAVAGVVLGGQSVPDGLASGLLAGVNPVYGLYAYLFGMLGSAFVTGSEFMTVQATGAMAAVIADVSLSAYAGAALAMIPKPVADDAIKAKEIGEGLGENAKD